jgi:hypothetical protein
MRETSGALFVDGRRLAIIAGVGVLALVALALLRRPPARADGPHAGPVALVETLLDGLPFSKIEWPGTGARLRILDNPRKRPLAELADRAGALAAWNGGFYEPDFSPSGLLVERGRTLSPLTERGGSGVWVQHGRRAAIVPRGRYHGTPAPDLAVQCGPILLERGGVMGISSDRPPTAARAAICVSTRRAPSLYVTWERITLHRLARILKAQHCDTALNLDGGPSTGLWVRGRVGHEPARAVRTVIALLPSRRAARE